MTLSVGVCGRRQNAVSFVVLCFVVALVGVCRVVANCCVYPVVLLCCLFTVKLVMCVIARCVLVLVGFCLRLRNARLYITSESTFCLEAHAWFVNVLSAQNIQFA